MIFREAVIMAFCGAGAETDKAQQDYCRMCKSAAQKKGLPAPDCIDCSKDIKEVTARE